jgi:hypothetical protein
MGKLQTFRPAHIEVVNNAVAASEELVSNAYKMSTSQWLRRKYDVRTLVDLGPDEIVYGPFAQLIRYEGQRNDSSLGSASYDFYKICLQDHAILKTLEECPDIELMPFTMYVVVHELVHIVRFSMFLQSFQASRKERLAEERRVHDKTRQILENITASGVAPVCRFFYRWQVQFDEYRDF